MVEPNFLVSLSPETRAIIPYININILSCFQGFFQDKPDEFILVSKVIPCYLDRFEYAFEKYFAGWIVERRMAKWPN